MAYFEDLSPYSYMATARRPNTFNVGWLDAAHPFPTERAPEDVLERLWSFCEWSVPQTRGFHVCELAGCETRSWEDGPIKVSRGGRTLALGSAEIRVFGADGRIFAAPSLIYHYVLAHSYKMPIEFVRALVEGPCPPDAHYFERLQSLDLTASKTLPGN